MSKSSPEAGPLAGRSLRVIIVDDEPLARDCVRLALQNEPGVEVVAECRDGESAVTAIRAQAPDLVFLDVQMPGLDGFDVIAEVGPEAMPAVIFVTAYDDHALRAFEVHALDYLLKPFDDARFAAAWGHAREQLAEGSSRRLAGALRQLLEEQESGRERATRLMVRSQGRIRLVRVEDVDWFEGTGNYVRLHVGDTTHLIRASLGGLEARLDPTRFMRIHRSTIVNLDRIREIQPWGGGAYVAILRDGQRLRVSRGYREALLRPLL